MQCFLINIEQWKKFSKTVPCHDSSLQILQPLKQASVTECDAHQLYGIGIARLQEIKILTEAGSEMYWSSKTFELILWPSSYLIEQTADKIV